MYLLHSAPDSASTIIRLLLEEAGMPYRCVPVAPADQTGSYRGVNPTGLIPALETPQGILFETGAILLWLSDRHGFGPHEAAPARLTLLKWLFFVSNTVHADLNQLFYPERYVPEAAHAGHHALVSARLQKHFALLNEAALDAPALFAVGGVLAPYLACLMRWAVLYPEGQTPWFTLGHYPALRAMAQTLEGHAATQRLIAQEDLGAQAFTAPRPATATTGTAA